MNWDIHVALASISVLEEAGVLDGDGLSLLGLCAGALLGGGLGNAHDCLCLGKGSCGSEGVVGSVDG